MATKKTSQDVVLENNEAAVPAEDGRLAEMQKKLAELQAANAKLEKEKAELQKNSIRSASPFGGGDDWERVHKACADAAEAGLDPWKEKISVKAPRIGKGEDSYWLSVNGRTMQVPANERYYELALPFAQCLVDEIRNRYSANDFIDSIENYDPVTNPKADK